MSAKPRWSIAAGLLACAVATGCHDPRPRESGNSNWLACDADSDCDEGLACACGVCAKPCDRSAECPELAAASGCFDAAAEVPASDASEPSSMRPDARQADAAPSS